MHEFSTHKDKETTAIESKQEKYREYFLGRLSEDESERLEEELAVDGETFQEAEIVERELIDDYIRDVLPNADREDFHVSYLLGKGRREKLTIAGSLWRVANEHESGIFSNPEPTAPSVWQLLVNWRGLASAAAALLLIAGVFYFALGPRVEDVAEKNLANEQVAEISNPDEKPGPAPSNVDLHVPVPPPLIIPSNGETKVPETPQTRSPAHLATFTLLPGSLRDEGEQSIKIGPKTSDVRLDLRLATDAPKYRTYVATLKTADGDPILVFKSLKSLRLNLPAAKLENRTYVIFLEGRNSPAAQEAVAEYTFRVRR